MSEQVYVYDLKNKHTLKAKDRDLYYSEQIALSEKGLEPTEAVEVIQVFLFNSDGDLLVQKRGKSKSHNPGLYDKSLGGHIKFSDSPDHTVLMETIEELQAPSIVLSNAFDFDKTFKALKNNLQSVALIKQYLVGSFINLNRIIKNEQVIIANKVHLYLGVYDGTTRPADREAAGVLYFNLDDLKEAIKNRPEDFTGDLKFYLENFEEDLRGFIKYIKLD